MGGSCQDRVPHRGRNPGVPRGHGLGDVEGIPTGHPVQLVRVDPCAAGEPCHGLARETAQADPTGPREWGDVSHGVQRRVPGPELVGPVGHHQEGPGSGQPPAEEAHQVEGRFVRPVKVLDHHDSRRTGRPQGPQERAEQVERRRFALQQDGELPAGRRGDVVERSERPRRRERIAAADPGFRPTPRLVEERPHQRGLADARLPLQQHDLPGTEPGGSQQPLELGQLPLSLQELGHRVIRPVAQRRNT